MVTNFARVVIILALVLMIACDPVQQATVIVAPHPTIRSDTAKRAAYSRTVLDLVARVATRDSLQAYPPQGKWYYRWQQCLALRAFSICGGEDESVVRLQFTQRARFTDESNGIRREIVDSLRQAFGNSVRECGSHRLRYTCPSLAQVDSSR